MNSEMTRMIVLPIFLIYFNKSVPIRHSSYVMIGAMV